MLIILNLINIHKSYITIKLIEVDYNYNIIETMSNNEKYANLWFSQAKYDLKAADNSMSNENHEWACFQAHQSAEKALKAFLFLNRKRNVFTHSIKKLIEKCSEFSDQFLLIKEARILDQYYIPTRYPNGLLDEIPHEFYEIEDAKICLNHARKIIKLVGNLLKKD